MNTGIRYLGGFLVAEDEATAYIGYKSDNWFKSVTIFLCISEKEPKKTFAGIIC